MRLLRELSRRRLRTTLTITGITIGIRAIVVFSSLANQINGLVGWPSPLRGAVELVLGEPLWFDADTDHAAATTRLEAAVAAL